MSDDAFSANGHCHCGAERFLVAAAPMLTEFCHCESCRRSVGTQLMTWAGFARDAVTITQGEPVAYESSPGVIHTFCGICGTSLTLGDERFASEIYVATAAFDDPGTTEAIALEVHIWRSERLP
ncbi:MAG: GFA family protein [Pseudomonadota bacterium]|nr:GFA family protein [Pseudomonadota bacterium]